VVKATLLSCSIWTSTRRMRRLAFSGVDLAGCLYIPELGQASDVGLDKDSGQAGSDRVVGDGGDDTLFGGIDRDRSLWCWRR
jgi:hypothetical protein